MSVDRLFGRSLSYVTAVAYQRASIRLQQSLGRQVCGNLCISDADKGKGWCHS